jgi:cystathionine beta-lyase/cystathionine gamma-synthase
MDRFPKMLFRFPGADAALQDGRYALLTVHDEEAHDAALSDGWHEDPAAARQAHVEAQARAAEEAAAAATARDAEDLEKMRTAPPTRAEMEQKARELELKFDGRTSDAKLLRMIEAALAPA